jgi:hypothetical protein
LLNFRGESEHAPRTATSRQVQSCRLCMCEWRLRRGLSGAVSAGSGATSSSLLAAERDVMARPEPWQVPLFLTRERWSPMITAHKHRSTPGCLRVSASTRADVLSQTRSVDSWPQTGAVISGEALTGQIGILRPRFASLATDEPVSTLVLDSGTPLDDLGLNWRGGDHSFLLGPISL